MFSARSTRAKRRLMACRGMNSGMGETLEILERLVAFPTVSADSNLAMVAYLREFLGSRGFELHQIDDPTGQKAGLFATLGPSGPGGILLSAHTDVVPVEGQTWTRPPFELTREGRRVFGRGTTDMKGFLACALAAADRASRADLVRPFKLSLSYDEEVGCLGIAHMIGELEGAIGLPDLAIVGEPTSMQVAIGHKGKCGLRAVCHGQSGHSALAPKFVNALHLAADFMAELRALQDRLAATGARDADYGVPYSTAHVGKLSGGMALNMVPDRAEMLLEYRHLATDRSVDLLAAIRQVAERAAAPYRPQFPDARIEVEPYMAYPGLDVPADAPVVQTVMELAQTRETTKVSYGTEAGFFAGLGIPTVVCGPGSMDDQGHKPDESIAIAHLQACDAMLDRVLRQLG